MKKANKLINEKSPYLLQHAYNPVDWYSWNEEAFLKAKAENKPIFLSIGYSTCHWCHVMEKESFEDEQIAKILNDHFISIKVDREERPDVDMIYMNYCMMLTGSGGWPLTIFMTPDKKPFYAGTYFPKENRYGRIGLTALLNRIVDLWKNDNKAIIESSENIFKIINQSVAHQDKEENINEEIIKNAYNTFKTRYDEVNGGFGERPKFPTPQNYLFLLRHYYHTGDKFALEMVENSATKMRLGGIYDHIGFGFHRYSTDEKWLVPHFEKMLYDQALLSILYVELYQLTKKEFYKKTAEEIFEYVLRDMTDPAGGFFSAEDADSEGEEGKFYLWKYDEIKKILGSKAEIFIDTFNISENGNLEIDIHDTGKNILYLNKTLRAISNEKNIDEKEFENMRQLLFNYRNQRIHPLKDDKILTDWNGLMIAAFAIGHRVLGNEIYLKAALNATNFIINKMIKPDGTLYHRYRDNEVKVNGNLDDYSFFIWGLLELYQASYDTKFLKRAINLLDIQIKNFWDNVGGGFFFTDKNESRDLIQRPKVFHDSAIPSGNSISLYNLIRLYHITGNSNFANYYQELLKACSHEVVKNPYYYPTILSAYIHSIYPLQEIIIVGKRDEVEEILNLINNKYNPNRVILLKSEEAILNDIAPFTVGMKKLENKPTVYICENFTCKLPIISLEEIEKYL